MKALKHALTLLKEIFLHPLETSVIDSDTGEVVERQRREEGKRGNKWTMRALALISVITLMEIFLHPFETSVIDLSTGKVERRRKGKGDE